MDINDLPPRTRVHGRWVPQPSRVLRRGLPISNFNLKFRRRDSTQPFYAVLLLTSSELF